MNEIEKEGCKQILDMLSYTDLSSLVDTTTKKQIQVSRKSEAVKAILEYTPRAVDLLKRKKVKRDILFKFLADKKVVVAVTLDKSGLIREILKRWGTEIQEYDMELDLDDDSSSTQLAQSSGNQPYDSSTPQNASYQIENTLNQLQQGGAQGWDPGNQPQQGGAQGGDPGSQSFQININVHKHVNVTNIHNQTHISHNRFQGGQHGPVTSINMHNPEQIHAGGNIPDVLAAHQIENPSTMTVSAENQTLGEKFAEWFYNNLNSHCPSLHKTPEDFGPHHFWDDVYLVLNTCTPNPNEEKIEGPLLVSQRFLAFSKEEQLLFNPNLTREGIYVKSNQHGLVMILVCGTIHRNNECLGVFQQLFGIIKDPRFENNWKIKMTKLEVKASKETAIPKLEGNLDTQIMSLVAV